MQFDQEAMMRRDTAMQRRHQLCAARFESPGGEIGQPCRIRLARDERFENRSTAGAQNVADDVGQLQIRVLQRLLDAQGVPDDSPTSCLRVRVRSRSSWISAGGTKLPRIKPCASRSAIHVASFVSLLRPGRFRMCIALARTTVNWPSSARTAPPDTRGAR